MRTSFEASLPSQVERASRIKVQKFIPHHWFATAASECASMYVTGFFYGAISVSQAYVEALSKFLVESHGLRQSKDPKIRWKKLLEEKVVSKTTHDAAVSVFDKRNDYHHLNKEVEQDCRELEERAETCLHNLHTIETEIFAHSFDKPGILTPHEPRYWPEERPGMVRVNLRKVW